MALPADAVLPAGALVLVTGVSGLVGCEVANQLLTYGYHVRGTVRDTVKSAWIQEQFDKDHGSGKFELVQVPDLGVEGSLDEAVKGVTGVLHTASNVTFGPDPNIVVNETIKIVLNALESALKEPSIKRFVLTSSASAVKELKFNEVYDITQESWNEASVKEAWAPPPYDYSRGLAVYNASKVQGEQALWKFVTDRKPHFECNSVLPDFVTGSPVNPAKQGYPSSTGLVKMLWEGEGEMWKMLYPQYMIDAKDDARLHVAALAHPDVVGERVFAFAFAKNWTGWLRVMRGLYPERTFPEAPEGEGEDWANVVGRPRAEGLLRWLGREGFRPMDESIRELCDSF